MRTEAISVPVFVFDRQPLTSAPTWTPTAANAALSDSLLSAWVPQIQAARAGSSYRSTSASNTSKNVASRFFSSSVHRCSASFVRMASGLRVHSTWQGIYGDLGPNLGSLVLSIPWNVSRAFCCVAPGIYGRATIFRLWLQPPNRGEARVARNIALGLPFVERMEADKQLPALPSSWSLETVARPVRQVEEQEGYEHFVQARAALALRRSSEEARFRSGPCRD